MRCVKLRIRLLYDRADYCLKIKNIIPSLSYTSYYQFLLLRIDINWSELSEHFSKFSCLAYFCLFLVIHSRIFFRTHLVNLTPLLTLLFLSLVVWMPTS